MAQMQMESSCVRTISGRCARLVSLRFGGDDAGMSRENVAAKATLEEASAAAEARGMFA
jgi:hypothetical protein